MLTKFQHEYLAQLIKNGIDGRPIGKILFAITSANHENTRRNPIPLYLRTLAIDRFAENLNCEFKIYPIDDIGPTDKFAAYILRQIFYQGGETLTPENTVLVCSTPEVITLFEKLKFKNMPIELVDIDKDVYSALRPYKVINLLVASNKTWREKSAKWQDHAFPAVIDIYKEYALGDLIIEMFQDSLLNEDAGITETRNYWAYAEGMDKAVGIKFDDIRPFVREGKIVDVGCATGSLIKLLATEFHESDIIGIEAARKFYNYCKNQEYESPFVFFYQRNIVNQNFKENTINTFIYSSVMHEVYSYMGEDALRGVLKNTYTQLDSQGRIIIRDVIGPDRPHDTIFMELNEKDGKSSGAVVKLSTYAKFFQFVKDFLPRQIVYSEEVIDSKKFIKISRQDAYEYISKMDYVENWDSEMHEEFGFYTFEKWCEELRNVGFDIIVGSRSFYNPYIIDYKYKGRAAWYARKDGILQPEEFSPTNIILVGQKPASF